jgi:hypothetical protein
MSRKILLLRHTKTSAPKTCKCRVNNGSLLVGWRAQPFCGTNPFQTWGQREGTIAGLGKGRKGKEKSRVGKGERKVCCKSRRQVFFRVRKKGVCCVSQGMLETCLSRGANYMFQNVAGEGIPHTAYPRNVSYLWIPGSKGYCKSFVLNCIIYRNMLRWCAF